jgi:hypothetical protein
VKHLVPLLLALTPACVVPLREADLRPIARNDAPPIAVTVSAAAASDDLVRPSDQTAGDLSTLVLRVHLHNAAATAFTEQPARYRLNVVGADGQRVGAVAAAWAAGDLPSAVPERLPEGAATTLTVPPGGTVTIRVAFRGLAGLPLSAPARIDLVLPDRQLLGHSGFPPAGDTESEHLALERGGRDTQPRRGPVGAVDAAAGRPQGGLDVAPGR